MSDSSFRKPPRWAKPFIAALLRTGEVREAAKWTGVDHTTVYARRKAHPDFAKEWDEALEGRRILLARKEELEIAQLRSEVARLEARAAAEDEEAIPPHPFPLPAGEREIGARCSPVPRTGSAARWTDAKERRFFEELMASANVRRAADAAGVSVQAVYARRSKHVPFRLRWAQALEQGRAAIEAHLVAQAQRALDPETMDLPEPAPKVSISEGIKIAQMSQGRGPGGRSSGRGGWTEVESLDEQAAKMSEEEVAELRERIMTKLRRLRERMIRDEGWSEDEKHKVAIPPGWIRDPDYQR